MTRIAPDKLWWTATELAEAGLPDLPGTRQNVEATAKRLGWRADPAHCRRRTGRGGGFEYLWTVLPTRAKQMLLRRAADAPVTPKAPDTAQRAAQAQYFDTLPDAAKTRAIKRLRSLQKVQALEHSGLTRTVAVEVVAKEDGVSSKTVWNWFGLVEMVEPADWLFFLADKHRAAARVVTQASCSGTFKELLKADFLRLEGPSFCNAYDRAVEICQAKGKSVLGERTARRWLDRTVPRVTQVYAREGLAGLMKTFPPQLRDRTGMVAMEGVNADCHKFDVFVMWPGEDKPERVQIVAFQDLYSSKILSWRIDRNPNKVAVMAAFGDLVEQYGIPKHCLFDNGREFANKWLTAGAKTRFRFKVREDDPLGVLSLLGIKIHWATPAHGQAKPIERAFRDFADRIAKDPRFAGAYVGNRPDAKPENYGSKAIPLDRFVAVVAEGVARHNAKLGRRSPTALGRSFDETFAESYATAPIRKATDEHRRLWLMGQEVRKMHATHGRITFHDNMYHSAWMSEHAGQSVVIRFNPDDLHAGLYVYAKDGAFMGFAACQEATGFFDLTGAREQAKRLADYKAAERKMLDKHRKLTARDVAAELDAISPDAPAPVEAKVVKLVPEAKRVGMITPHRDRQVATPDPEEDAAVLEFQARFAAEAAAAQAKQDGEPADARGRYMQALDIERRSDAGSRVGQDEMAWLLSYQQTAEYRGERRVHEDFGESYLK